MMFHETLNDYIIMLDCTAKDIALRADISAASFSRYRTGERIPKMGTETFNNLCAAIAQIAECKGITQITSESVCRSFINCSDFVAVDKDLLCRKFDALITLLNINLSQMCRQINYDISTVVRFKQATRRPSDPVQFAEAVASYAAENITPAQHAELAKLIGCDVTEIADISSRSVMLNDWMLNKRPINSEKDNVSDFLDKLDKFDLNEYIKSIHFDELKVPTVPFQLPTSKYYYGLKQMMNSEFDFLKATVLSKSKKPVTLFSDMPMEEMAKDAEFPKKWMYGMALMLKKGLHLNNIHNLDRPFNEMMLGLESWIPMYMTGQITPYYLKDTQKGAFHHFLRVSGAAALSGEAISGHHANGRYYLSKTREDIAYYQKRADDLLKNASPLMEVYREDSAQKLKQFISSDTAVSGNRRNVLSAPPIYTMNREFLESILKKRSVSEDDINRILNFADIQRENTEKLLCENTVKDEILQLTEEKFKIQPVTLPLSGMFYNKDINYTYEEYAEHLRQTREFDENHSNYTALFTSFNPFRNLQIIMHEEKWVMISKGNAPAIHFVIHQPQLRTAIENFSPPVVEE